MWKLLTWAANFRGGRVCEVKFCRDVEGKATSLCFVVKDPACQSRLILPCICCFLYENDWNVPLISCLWRKCHFMKGYSLSKMDAASQCEMTQLPWNFTLSHKTQQSLMFSYWKSNKCTITSMTGSDREKGNTVDVMSVCQSIDSWPEISCFHTTKLPVFAFFCVKGTDAAAWEEHVLFVSVSLSMRSQLIGNFTLSPVTQHKFSHLLFYVWNVSTQAAYFPTSCKSIFFFLPLSSLFSVWMIPTQTANFPTARGSIFCWIVCERHQYRPLICRQPITAVIFPPFGCVKRIHGDC